MGALSRPTIAFSRPQIFNPDAADDFHSPTAEQITLTQAYFQFLEPLLSDRAKATRTAIKGAIDNWARITEDPPVSAITDLSLLAFRQARLADVPPGSSEKSAWTVNKDLRGIRRVLRHLGPRSHGNPAGLGLISIIPYCEMLAAMPGELRIASDAELSALFSACDVATWPRTRVPAPQLWRALLVCAYNWGANRQDLYRLSDVSIAAGDGRNYGPRTDRLYVRFVRQKTRRKKPQPLVIPLNATVAMHVQGLLCPGERLFPFPAQNHRDFKRQWDRIHADAGISLDRKIHFQDLRKTCNTRFDEISAGIGEWILGHAARDVNRKFYLDVSARILDAVDRLPQPSGFKSLDRQRRLF
ncbi:MAG: hypothetical protein KGL39_37850 [Patescibacteria group bacterium]|nr:hypothetical protein [Patescibacteria group bacterium]